MVGDAAWGGCWCVCLCRLHGLAEWMCMRGEGMHPGVHGVVEGLGWWNAWIRGVPGLVECMGVRGI